MSAKTRVAYVELDEKAPGSLRERVVSAAFSPTQRIYGIAVSVGFFIGTVFMLTSLTLHPYYLGLLRLTTSFHVVLFLGVVTMSCFDSRDGLIRYRLRARLSWISQVPWLGRVVSLCIALVAMAFAVYSAFYVGAGIVRSGGDLWRAAPLRAWIVGLVLLGLTVYALRETARAFRANIGVRLAPDRVGIHHEHSDLFLQWREIERVAVEMVNKGTGRKKRMVSCVRIEARGSRVFYVEVRELGSDPNVVAALMQYYLERPQERDALVDPEEAIRRFRDAQDRDC